MVRDFSAELLVQKHKTERRVRFPLFWAEVPSGSLLGRAPLVWGKRPYSPTLINTIATLSGFSLKYLGTSWGRVRENSREMTTPLFLPHTPFIEDLGILEGVS
jgi:hypothetical protein